MQVAQGGLAAIRGVGSQAQEEVVVWARLGALLGDPLPERQRALPKEERAALAMRVCRVLLHLVQEGDGLMSPTVPHSPKGQHSQ